MLYEDIFFFFQAEDGIRDYKVTGVQTCALPISTLIPWRGFWCATRTGPASCWRWGPRSRRGAPTRGFWFPPPPGGWGLWAFPLPPFGGKAPAGNGFGRGGECFSPPSGPPS